MKALMIAAGAAAMTLAGCATTRDEPPEIAVDPNSPLAAPGYMRMAASSDLFEIESSRLALQRSQNPAVRSFAQMMIDHHTRTTQDLMRCGADAGLPPPPPGLMPHHRDALERLRMAPPGEFDAGYKREQITGHREALALHRNYADRGDNSDLRRCAGATWPIVERHLREAEGLPEWVPPPPAPRRAGERG